MEHRVWQNSLMYNWQTSDSQKSIIGCRSLEIEFTFTQFRKLIFGNRYITNRSLEIDFQKLLFANGKSIFGNWYSESDIGQLIFRNWYLLNDLRRSIFRNRYLVINIQKLRSRLVLGYAKGGGILGHRAIYLLPRQPMVWEQDYVLCSFPDTSIIRVWIWISEYRYLKIDSQISIFEDRLASIDFRISFSQYWSSISE